jgi:hypothetical protein
MDPATVAHIVQDVMAPPRYKIIRGTDMLDLADAVNQAMDAGWEPLGGVMYAPPDPIESFAAGATPHPYYQALVRPTNV